MKIDYSRIARKITITLFAVRSLTSAGFIVSGTVGAIVSANLGGNPAWAGIPAAVMQIGAAIAAPAMGVLTDRIGRRGGFTLGLTAGVIGAGLAASAITSQVFLVYIAAMLFMGVALTSSQLSRFAAAEVNPPQNRGRAISYVLFGGTIGAVVGPLLAGPSGMWAVRFGLNELAGPYLITLVILSLAALTTFIWLRPEPRDVGVQISKIYPEIEIQEGTTRSPSQIMRTPNGLVAVSAMVIGQMVMVMVMGITSLYMMNNQHTLTGISLVISAHTFGMFAPSVFTGHLVDRWGRGPVILSGAGILILAAALAPLSIGVFPLGAALFLLGLGWNFCYVSGSTLLSDQLSPPERARTQGANDMLVGFATATASIGSGLLYASIGYASMGIIGMGASLILLGLTIWWMIRGRTRAGDAGSGINAA
jgi:MFS family permease